MNKLVLCGYLLFITYLITAQFPEPRKYNFTHYIEETGLISYQVNSTVQDEDGYIWIASNEGLQRFDGIRHKNFRHRENDPYSIPSRSILQIFTDAQKNLWLLSDDGKVGVFNTKSFIFREATIQLKYLSPINLLQQQRIIADEYGHVFLLLPGKALLTYNQDKNEFSEDHNFIVTPEDWEILDLIQEPGRKRYWMCLRGKGFAVFDLESGELSSYDNNTAQEDFIDYYRQGTNPYRLFFDSKGRIWHAGIEDGWPQVFAFDPQTNKPLLDHFGFSKQVPRYHEINGFLEQRDGSVWIYGVHIFAKYLEEDKQFEQVFNGYVDEHSIDYVVITGLREDREGNIWVGTANNGLYRFNPAEEFFTTIDHPSKLIGNMGSGAPVTFMHDLDGSILVGVWADGLYRYDSDLNPIPLGIKGYPKDKITPILHMYPSGSGTQIWMAASGGIYKYDQLKREVQFHHLPELKSRIRQVVEDHSGNLWIGLQEHGVYKWEYGTTENKISAVSAIPMIRIQDMMVDREGLLWVATMGNGLYVIDPETSDMVTHFHAYAPLGKKLPDRSASSLLDYNDSLVLIGSRNNLLVYNRHTKNLLSITNGDTVSGVIQAIEKDAVGNVWFSTTTGLYRFSRERRVFIKFNRRDGIRNDYFVISSSHALPDGKMLFGASSSMLVFNPSDIRINTDYPTVHITDFKVMNRGLPVDSLLKLKTIRLPFDQNSLAIDLSPMSYNTGYVVRYKLEGLDTEWQVADRSYQIIYSYLPPGDYVLRVVPINAEGLEGDQLKSLDISIAPPFWKTWWFLSLLTLLVVVVLYLLDKARMQRKEALLQMRSEIAGNLHEEVNTAMYNINILSEMAKMKAQSDPQKTTQFIEQIHSKSHQMIFALDDMLWSIAPENDSMEKTLDRMKEFIDALNNRHNVGIEMLVDKQVKSVKLNMQMRYEAFMLFKENIRALMKAGARDCKIHLTIEKSNLLYTIQFDKACCDAEQLKHLQHRQDMIRRLALIDARVKMRAHNNHSLIELFIPISRKAG